MCIKALSSVPGTKQHPYWEQWLMSWVKTPPPKAAGNTLRVKEDWVYGLAVTREITHRGSLAASLREGLRESIS